MYPKGHITREDEANIPTFHSHEEARSWFKEKYGDRFIMTGSQEDGEGTVYFYSLILDVDKYNEFQRKMAEEGGLIGEMELMFSYQSIEITSDGYIHVIH